MCPQFLCDPQMGSLVLGQMRRREEEEQARRQGDMGENPCKSPPGLTEALVLLIANHGGLFL